MSSEEISHSDEESNRSEEESENSGKSGVSDQESERSVVEESEKSGNESESSKESNKSELKSVRFDTKKLILSNEIVIDISNQISNQVLNKTENVVLERESKTSISNASMSLKLLSEINFDLDNLEKDLNKTIKSFSIRKNQPGSRDYDSLDDEKEEKVFKANHSEISYRNKKKKFVDEGANTDVVGRRTSGLHRDLKESKKYNDEEEVTHSRNEYVQGGATYPNSNKNYNYNRMRTVEDLYRNKNTQPIIYNKDQYIRKGENLMINTNEYESEDMRKSREKYNNYLTQKNKYRPKNINHAMNILLDNDI